VSVVDDDDAVMIELGGRSRPDRGGERVGGRRSNSASDDGDAAIIDGSC